MKLLYLANSKIPSRTANSIQVMKMSQAFAKNGHNVTVLTPDYRDIEPNVVDIYRFYGVEACFRVKTFPYLRSKWRRLIAYNRILALLVKMQKPDVVFAHCGSLPFSLGTLGLPVILEAHRFIPKTQQFVIDLLGSKHLKRIVVISGNLSQAYRKEYNIPNFLIQVAHDGADEPVRHKILNLGSPKRLQVGYVGHLYPGRGMEIIAELAKSCSWADFHIVGGMDSDVSYWRGSLQCLGNIYFTGFLPFPSAEQYRLSVDILIAPYQHQILVAGGEDIGSANWMSPMKIFEYMAAGKAMLISDIPVLREVLTHGETAWLCNPDDPESWINGLTYLRDHPELRSHLGRGAKKTFAERHTWRARAASVIDGIA